MALQKLQKHDKSITSVTDVLQVCLIKDRFFCYCMPDTHGFEYLYDRNAITWMQDIIYKAERAHNLY